MGWQHNSGNNALQAASATAHPTGAVGLSAWVKLDASMDSGVHTIITTDDFVASYRYWQFRFYTDKLQLIIFIGGTQYILTGATDITSKKGDGLWHWVAGTFDGLTLKCYIDSTTPDGTLSQFGNMDHGSAANLEIAFFNSGNMLRGKIAECGISRAAYSSGDITNLFTYRHAPKIVDPTNAIHYYSLLTTDSSNGRLDAIGTDGLSGIYGSTDSDHPAGMVYTANKYRIPTTVADGTTQKLIIYSDSTLGTVVAGPVDVTSSGGFFDYPSATAALGTKYRCFLSGFGATSSDPADGGVAWATGVAG